MSSLNPENMISICFLLPELIETTSRGLVTWTRRNFIGKYSWWSCVDWACRKYLTIPDPSVSTGIWGTFPLHYSCVCKRLKTIVISKCPLLRNQPAVQFTLFNCLNTIWWPSSVLPKHYSTILKCSMYVSPLQDH